MQLLNFGMFAFEFESRKVVIEFCVTPICGVMTGGAILPEPAFMLIILLMARETILRRRLQIRKGSGIDMAFFAGGFSMFAVQFENKSSMGKVIAKPIHLVMADKTIRAK